MASKLVLVFVLSIILACAAAGRNLKFITPEIGGRIGEGSAGSDVGGRRISLGISFGFGPGAGGAGGNAGGGSGGAGGGGSGGAGFSLGLGAGSGGAGGAGISVGFGNR